MSRHSVGAARDRLQQLIFVDDEVLAQQRHVDGGANLLQVVEAAIEECGLGEDGNRRRSGPRVCGRVRGRVVVLAQDSFRRRTPLAFGDDARCW